MTSGRDLDAWKRSVDPAEACSRESARLSAEERFSFGNPLRRAAVSISANIAEGHWRPPSPDSRLPTPQSRLLTAANAVLSVVLAARCAACQSVLPAPLTGPVCDACWNAVRLMTPPVCDGCGDPLPSWRVVSASPPRCPRCVRARHAVDRGRAVGEYQGALRQIIHALKYEGRRSVARDLATLMRKRGSHLLDGVDGVVPVPLHPTRERTRGFNQATELARHLGLLVWPALRRVRPTVPQVELPEAQRHANVFGAFVVNARSRWPISYRTRALELSDACVLLVDDVSTTGATLEACARVLKEAGVREVRALTAARVVRRQFAPRLP